MYEIEKYESVKKWMGRLAPSTQTVQINYFKYFIKWIRGNDSKFSEMSPDDMIEYALDASSRELNEIMDMIIDYINSTNGRAETKKSRYTNIRSFFKHNRVQLPSDPFIIRGDVPPVQGTLTAGEIKKTVLACKPPYAAAFLSMFQGFMDQEMFKYWNENGYTQLLKDLDAFRYDVPDDAVIKIDLPGRKRNKNIKPYYTFIGKDAITALKNYLKRRPDNQPVIFLNQVGKPISKSSLRHYWVRQLRRVGVVKHTKGQRMDKTGKGLHEMRDVARSLWEKSPASGTVAEYCMGHTIDPLEYDKSFRDIDYYKAEYLKAAPHLNIMSSGEAFGRVEKTEVERLRRQIRDMEKSRGDRIEQLEAQVSELMDLVKSREFYELLKKKPQ